jgi:hypothetical protein
MAEAFQRPDRAGHCVLLARLLLSAAVATPDLRRVPERVQRLPESVVAGLADLDGQLVEAAIPVVRVSEARRAGHLPIIYAATRRPLEARRATAPRSPVAALDQLLTADAEGSER